MLWSFARISAGDEKVLIVNSNHLRPNTVEKIVK